MVLKITLSKKIATFLICFFITVLSFAQEPNAPTGLSVSSSAANQFTLTWDADSNATGGYNIFIVEGSSGDIFIETIAAGSTSYTYSGTYGSVTVTDGGNYIAKIQALPDADFNAYSEISITLNGTPPTEPNAPTGLSVSSSAANQFTLTWDADSNATGGYNIFIVEGSSGDIFIETIAAGSTSYTYSGTYGSVTVADGGNYIAKIQALPDADFNAYSEVSTGVLSTNSFDDIHFKMYPNPVNDILNISNSRDLESFQVSIYNVVGKLIKKTKEKNINVSNLKKGLYLVAIENEKGQKMTKKFIKN